MKQERKKKRYLNLLKNQQQILKHPTNIKSSDEPRNKKEIHEIVTQEAINQDKVPEMYSYEIAGYFREYMEGNTGEYLDTRSLIGTKITQEEYNEYMKFSNTIRYTEEYGNALAPAIVALMSLKLSKSYNKTNTDSSSKLLNNKEVSRTKSEYYLNEALKQQKLKEIPKGLKQKWADGEYKYEVRVHEGNKQFTESNSIYRVARQKIPELGTQGSGWEYMDNNGNWYHESVLKEYFRDGSLNPNFNENAAKNTHIPVKN